MKTAIFCILLLCLFSFDLKAQDTLIPHFSASEIRQNDISQQLVYLSIGRAETPHYREPLQEWLGTFEQHNPNDPFKDRYVTAFEIYNDTQNEQWFIYPSGSVIETVQVSLYSQHSPVESSISGLDHNNIYPLHYGSKLSIPAGETATLLMVFDSDFFFAPIKIVLETEEHMLTSVANHNVILFICFGIYLALGLYNLFIYIVMRDTQYLFYALSTLFYASAWAAIFGVFEYLNLFSAKDWLMPGFLLGCAFSAFFQIEFFRLNLTAKRTMLFLLALGCLCLLALPIAFYNQALGLIIVSILTTAVLLTGLSVGLVAWKRGYKPARYFVIASLCVIIPNVVGNLLNLRVLPSINVDIYLLGFIGIAADTLILAFALAEKMRLVNLRNSQLKSQLKQTVEFRTQALREANQKLAQSNQELIEANLAKDHFLANMSHEIRTPLTSIIGYADGMLLGDIDKTEQERVTSIIYQNGAHLLRIINDILDLSKIDANKLDFKSQPCHLFSLLGQIESVVGKRAKDKGLGFHVNYDFPLPEKIITDATRLKQILFNLTNNALKFTHSGHICLDVKAAGSTLTINVVDTGEGISQNDMQKLFNPFTQADSVINRQVGGTGLGLSIAKRLAQGLGGDINAKSQPRKGSTFTITIKLDTPTDVAWLNTAQEIDLSSIHQITHESHVPKFGACKVLLADDHPNNRELVALLLKRMNITVTEVADGHQAIDAIRAIQFDLLLLDIHMPGLNGVDTLRNIRKSGNKTPAIALTANTMQHEIDYYLRIGFTDHLAKPIERDVFIRKVRQYLNLSAKQVSVADDKMLPLIQGYIVDLRDELANIEQAWNVRDLPAIAKSIHRIKGAAGSFGLANVGKVFGRLERAALNDDEAGLENSIAQVLRFAHMCIDLPGVDVAQAIVNAKCELDEYLNRLPQTILQCESAIDELSQYAQRGDHIATADALNQAKQLFDNNAFTRASNLLSDLAPQSAHAQQNADTFNSVLASVRNTLQSLSEALKHNHIKR
ncbi:ATP-binding protein [Paraglaciecola chathamensis]|uniref:histidine kinase n=1 Tax=Paraglaciecola chathamensis TaxID=368405 RepID=A0A8H9IH68_9ALTE|nr:ATP-binding protein [Paraglaciecola oceanifecundans]GGZ71252.1 hypothetical protein GCM10011274_31910 [Paraglaciecola oceanifecundans]